MTSRCARPSGRLAGVTLGPLALGMTPPRARAQFTNVATRGRRDMDFFCPTTSGIRVGYPVISAAAPAGGR